MISNKLKKTKPEINPTSHWDCCLIGSVIKRNRTGTFQWVWLPNSNKLIKLNQRNKFDFVLHKGKMLPVLIESERSPSRMYVKQFDDKNISVNAELANQKYYRYSDWKSIKSHFVKTFGGPLSTIVTSASSELGTDCSVFQPENCAWGPKCPYNPFLGARYFKKGPMYQYLSNMQKRRSSWKVKEIKMSVYLKLTWSVPLYKQ